MNRPTTAPQTPPQPTLAQRLCERAMQWLVPRCGVPHWLPREAAEQRFQALFEQAGAPLLLCDRQGLVLAANTAAAGLINEVPARLLGRPLTQWVRQPGAAPAAAGAPALRNGDAELHAGGPEPRPVEVKLSPLPWAGVLPPDTDPATARRERRDQVLVELRDHSDRRKTQDHLTRLATLDSLTQLPNRTLFRDRLAQAMARAQRSGNPLALLFLDLDEFKKVNDGLGHAAGDELLRHVALTLSKSLRETDSVHRMVPHTLSRLGGDEFTVIAEDIRGADDAVLIANRLLDSLRVPYRLRAGTTEAQDVVVEASIGITLYPHEDVDLDELVRRTDMAMYSAKLAHRGSYTFFSQKLTEERAARLAFEGALRRATEKLTHRAQAQEFSLHYQPTVKVDGGETVGVEALLRWRSPDRGAVSPARFVPVLEATGLIFQVGAWVIREACRQLREWDLRGLPPLRMAVNVSPQQLCDPGLVSLIRDTLLDYDIEPGRLELEIIETQLAQGRESTKLRLQAIKDLGVRLALDDFGVGETNLARVGLVGVDTLKVDRSLVSGGGDGAGEVATGLNEDPKKRALSGTVIAMARGMGIANVIAEGVETEAQAQTLLELGCDEMQGYLLSRPLPPEDLVRWLEERARTAMLKRLSRGRPSETPLERLSLDIGDAAAQTGPSMAVVGHFPPAPPAAPPEDLGALAPSWGMTLGQDSAGR